MKKRYNTADKEVAYFIAEEYNFLGWYNTCDSDRHKLSSMRLAMASLRA